MRKKVDLPLALAGLFADCATDLALERCRVLKLSKNHTKHVKFLLAHRGCLLDFDMPLARLKTLLAKPYFRDLYELERALQKAATHKEDLAALIKLRRRIRDLGDIDVRPAPLLTGHDLIRLGAMPGPSLGQLAEELYIAQLEGEVQTKEQATRWAADWLRKHEDLAR
jgi:poly(A) polymerase